VWAIDNGLCFAAEFKLRTVIWEFAGDPLPARLETLVRRVAERGVGDDVAELVEVRAEAASLPVLAREHAVDRVERHAQHEPRRHQQEGARAGQRRDDAGAERDRQRGRGERDLVRGHAGAREPRGGRSQQRLEARLQRVERHAALRRRPQA